LAYLWTTVYCRFFDSHVGEQNREFCTALTVVFMIS